MREKYYLDRIADNELALRLEAFGAVQIKGNHPMNYTL